jgi:hypothetical protein
VGECSIEGGKNNFKAKLGDLERKLADPISDINLMIRIKSAFVLFLDENIQN